MSKILYIEEVFEPFKSSWGSMAVAQPFTDGYQVPDGWQNELDKKGIKYTVIDLVEHREALTEDLVTAAAAFGLGEFIQAFFFTHRKVIQKYILNGGDELYNLFLTAPEDLEKLDRTNAEGISPRMYALALLDFYKTNTNGNK